MDLLSKGKKVLVVWNISRTETFLSQQANVLKTLDNFTIKTWYSPWASILKVFDKPGSRIEDSVSRDGHVIYWSGKFIRVHSLPEIWLWNEDMAHGQHTKSSQLFWSVKYNRREPTRHLGIQPDLDTCLDLEYRNNSIWRTTFKKTNDNAKQRTLWPVTIILLSHWHFHLWVRSQSMI